MGMMMKDKSQRQVSILKQFSKFTVKYFEQQLYYTFKKSQD